MIVGLVLMKNVLSSSFSLSIIAEAN